MSLAADLDRVLTDLQVTVGACVVVFGGQQTNALLDQATDEPLPGHVSGVSALTRSVRIRTGTLPGVKIGSQISIGGVTYNVRNLNLLGPDGLVTQLLLHQ